MAEPRRAALAFGAGAIASSSRWRSSAAPPTVYPIALAFARTRWAFGWREAHFLWWSGLRGALALALALALPPERALPRRDSRRRFRRRRVLGFGAGPHRRAGAARAAARREAASRRRHCRRDRARAAAASASALNHKMKRRGQGRVFKGALARPATAATCVTSSLWRPCRRAGARLRARPCRAAAAGSRRTSA